MLSHRVYLMYKIFWCYCDTTNSDKHRPIIAAVYEMQVWLMLLVADMIPQNVKHVLGL